MRLIHKVRKALQTTGGLYALTDLAHLRAAARAGHLKVWGRDDSILIGVVDEYPRKRVLRFFLAAGTLDVVLRLAEEAYVWGREHGCTDAMFIGRRGWARALADEGWEEMPKVRLFTKRL